MPRQSPSILPLSFYVRPTLDVARDLLGKILVRRIGRTVISGRIVEVEAYLGERDEASHAFRGKTRRNEVMFRSGGHLYVYFTYGMHYCMNVVTEEEGTAGAVLIRAIEPLDGVDAMRKRRGLHVREHDLTNGPAKCCQAFGIDGEDNGRSLVGPDIRLTDAPVLPERLLEQTRRIGITRGKEQEWRFSVRGNPFVSRHSLSR